MADQKFSIDINAPRTRVWDMLWGADTYPQWTQPFCEGSFAESDWKEGSKILFMDTNRDGMISTIDKKVPNEYMSFKMLGCIKKGVEDYESDIANAVTGGYENYTLTESNGITTLVAELGGAEMPKDIQDYLAAAWPKALDELKRIAEK